MGFPTFQIEVITESAWKASNTQHILSKYHIKKTKRLASKPRYGQKVISGFWVPHREEQVIIQKMLKLRKSGYTFQKIANVLNEEKLTSRSGGQWMGCFVETIIKRELKQKK